MQYMLDTHILLWWLSDDKKLSADARKIISDANSIIYVSAVTTWEIEVKRSLGKLVAPTDIDKIMHDSDFVEMPIKIKHTMELGGLPNYHNDPFDRLLIAQCLVEGLMLITEDAKIKRYHLKCL